MKTREQLEKFRIPMPEQMAKVLEISPEIDFSEHVVEDEYGVYSTGMFRWKGKEVLITIDGGKWHLSASTNHPIGYYEMKEMRYEFLPNGISVAQIFPPPSCLSTSTRTAITFTRFSTKTTLLAACPKNGRPTTS